MLLPCACDDRVPCTDPPGYAWHEADKHRYLTQGATYSLLLHLVPAHLLFLLSLRAYLHIYLSYSSAHPSSFLSQRLGARRPHLPRDPPPGWQERMFECDAMGQPARCWRDACAGRWKAPRTRHCGDCGTCRAGLDHHCPWVSALLSVPPKDVLAPLAKSNHPDLGPLLPPSTPTSLHVPTLDAPLTQFDADVQVPLTSPSFLHFLALVPVLYLFVFFPIFGVAWTHARAIWLWACDERNVDSRAWWCNRWTWMGGPVWRWLGGWVLGE